ncbi:hypothetical protein MMC10_001806 [Thelotrema lepadinum]|nr:hypothetical protein [Thelotrema lepadinum]
MPPKYPHLDPFFGLDWVVMEIRNYVACRELPATTDLFRRIGNTFEINALRRTMIMTIDPENIHSPVASEGRDWSIEPVKVRFMDLVRGRESVSSYVFQRHSIRYRALVMRQVFLNLMKVSQGFRESVNDLLNLIPRHGASVDLADLLMHSPERLCTNRKLAKQFTTIDPESSSSNSLILMSFHEDLSAIRHSNFDLSAHMLMSEKGLFQTYSIFDVPMDQAIVALPKCGWEPQNNTTGLLNTLVQLTAKNQMDRDVDFRNMIASLDTTPVSLSNTMFLLSRDPNA